MKDITVSKTDLLKRLEENRDSHVEIFTEAVEGYRKEAESMLEQHLADIRQGKIGQVSVYLPVPENHTKDYNRVIEMVKMHTGDNFELSEGDFGKYVMDDWTWKRQFLASNAMYSLRAAEAAEIEGGI